MVLITAMHVHVTVSPISFMFPRAFRHTNFQVFISLHGHVFYTEYYDIMLYLGCWDVYI